MRRLQPRQQGLQRLIRRLLVPQQAESGVNIQMASMVIVKHQARVLPILRQIALHNLAHGVKIQMVPLDGAHLSQDINVLPTLKLIVLRKQENGVKARRPILPCCQQPDGAQQM